VKSKQKAPPSRLVEECPFVNDLNAASRIVVDAGDEDKELCVE
jgi:hypothetical protein